jgi:putative ABC transport system permease protein
VREVTPGFLEAVKVPLIRGRTIAETDRANVSKVVVVDEEAAKRFWPGDDPIGKRISFDDTSRLKDVEWITVIGVVGHMAHEGLDAERRVQLHFPHAQWGEAQLGFVIRTAGDPAAIVSSVRAAIREVDRDQPIADVFTMDTLMDRAVGQRRLLMTLLATFAALAMVLAALGIYGVMAFDVTRRSQEIGVRMALGAARTSVLGLVLKQGLTMAVIGVGVGVISALMLTRLLQTQLFGIASTDPPTFLSVALGLLGVAAFATLLPALRATRVNPTEALRYE